MGLVFAWPNEMDPSTRGLVLTFVVPADECNLSCSFCAIRQRKEALKTGLAPADYVHFLTDTVDARLTAIVAVQGYEPLLDQAWPYTRSILEAASSLGVPSSLVTNGVLLAARAHELARLRPAGVTVSLDAGQSERHDKLRGRRGAFSKAVEGLSAMIREAGSEVSVSVNSVMFPGRSHYLESVPPLLSSLGVRKWAVTPLIRIGNDRAGGPIEPSELIIQNLVRLNAIAVGYGIELTLYDELGQLSDCRQDFTELALNVFSRPDGLVRMGPSGHISVGQEILREVDDRMPVWRPDGVRPREFLAELVDRHIAPAEAA